MNITSFSTSSYPLNISRSAIIVFLTALLMSLVIVSYASYSQPSATAALSEAKLQASMTISQHRWAHVDFSSPSPVTLGYSFGRFVAGIIVLSFVVGLLGVFLVDISDSTLYDHCRSAGDQHPT